MNDKKDNDDNNNNKEEVSEGDFTTKNKDILEAFFCFIVAEAFFTYHFISLQTNKMRGEIILIRACQKNILKRAYQKYTNSFLYKIVLSKSMLV